MNNCAKIIVFEGPDGVGKTTQVMRLTQALLCANKRVTTIKFPMRGTLTGDTIYKMLDSGLAASLPTVFQAIQVIDKFVPQLLCLPYLLMSNDYIVLDRWSGSCSVYGNASGAAAWFMKFSSKLMLKPDLVIVMSGDGKRHDAVTNGDVYERNQMFQQRVRDEYATLVLENPLTHVSVDSTGTVDDVHNRILNVLVARKNMHRFEKK